MEKPDDVITVEFSRDALETLVAACNAAPVRTTAGEPITLSVDYYARGKASLNAFIYTGVPA